MMCIISGSYFDDIFYENKKVKTKRWNITYNNFNEPIEEIKNDGTNWKYEYNKKGLLTKKIEPNGTILLNLYDSCDRIVQEKRMGNGKTEIKSYNYDANGFMNQASDNGVTSLINYKNGEYKANAYNLTTSHTTTISGTSFMTEYEYDQGLRISAIKYPDERSVRYEYNGLGQFTGIQNADGEKYATKGTYDSLGRLVSLTAGNGTETSYTWDNEKGVLSGYSWGLSEYISRELTWDNEGNIVSILKGSFDNPYTNIYEYDKLGRLLHEKNGAKVEVTSKNIDKTRYLYVENDVSGKKQGKYTEEIINLDYYAGSIVIDLEEIQTVTTMKVFGKNERISSNHFEVWISEDNINWQKEKIRWENDFSGWNLIFDDNTKARYVKLHSLWDERDQNYNAVDKSTYKANIWNFFEVSFIANGKTNSWSYDSRGNRISESVSFGDNPGSINYYDYYSNSDLISKAGNWYFNYDKNGNLIAKGSSAILYPFDTFTSWDFAQNDGELWVYEYDLQNRMINAFYSGKGKANLKHRASYSYDYRGLLVQKNYNDYDLSNYIQLDNPSSSKEITEYYEYSPDDKLIYNEKIEDSCVHITDFIWTDTTLWSQLSNNNVFYHHSDHLGTSELISDSLGNVVWHADYDAFGSVMNQIDNQTFSPVFTGKFFDKTTGLYYFNARWYDSALGRFTTQDPARDGVNWWAYCGGNPIMFVDPTGREAGYYTDDDGAGGFGHSGMYVTGEDGKYYVFEVIGVGEKSNNKIAINNKKGTTLQDASGLNTTIISNITDNSFPPPELSEKMNKSGQAACLMRKFDSFEDMEVGLMKLGFDNCITFDTTPDQDSVILNAALSDGSDFSNYHLLSNSCGGWARDVLCTNGSGIKPFNPYANIKYLGSSAIPKAIGANLLLGNSNASYRDFGQK